MDIPCFTLKLRPLGVLEMIDNKLTRSSQSDLKEQCSIFTLLLELELELEL